jgi:transcriptional regulator with XRE-family HTH domain
MDTGATIRKLRKQRGLTQQQLADAVGCTDAAIRNYERNARTLKGDTLSKMAQALGVEQGTLVDHEIENAQDLLVVVFQMEGSLGLEPVETKQGLSIGMNPFAADAPKLQVALKAWQRKRSALQSGGITESEYELWKAGFKA